MNLLSDILKAHTLGDFRVPVDKLEISDAVRSLRRPGVDKLVAAFQQQGYIEAGARYIVCPSDQVRV